MGAYRLELSDFAEVNGKNDFCDYLINCDDLAFQRDSAWMTIEDESLPKVVKVGYRNNGGSKLCRITEIPISECGQRTPSDAECQKQPLRQQSGAGPVYPRWNEA